MKILSMPSTGPKKNVIYDSGIVNYALENPGSYVIPVGQTNVPATFNSTSIKMNVPNSTDCCYVGTAIAIDVTNYTKLKIRCKNAGQSNGLWLLSQKNPAASPRYVATIPESASYAESALDISAATGTWYVAITAAGGTGNYTEFNKLWLEE